MRPIEFKAPNLNLETLLKSAGVIWSRRWESLHGQGTLECKALKRDLTKFVLQAHLPPGMDIAPHVFIVGTLEECRAAFKRARECMDRWFKTPDPAVRNR